jgi:tetratricopeptide (TPR) repeat protein
MAEQQLKVFVSHSHQDNAFCHALVSALRGAGADVWYDEHDMGSGRLGPTIERELRERPVFVVILSLAALHSPWVEDETRWAYGLLRKDASRLILPVTATTIQEDDIWLFLQDFKRIEAVGYQPFPRKEAVRRTVRTLALTPTGEAPAPMAPQPTESVEDMLARGKALQAQGKYAEALALFERATQLAPQNFDAWVNLGKNLLMLTRWQDALAAIERAITLDPTWGSTWLTRGFTLNMLKRYAEALASFDRALALEPNISSSTSAVVYSYKGNALAGLTRYNEALVAYDQALALGETASRWKNKAATLRALGRTAEAEMAERRAKELAGE